MLVDGCEMILDSFVTSAGLKMNRHSRKLRERSSKYVEMTSSLTTLNFPR